MRPILTVWLGLAVKSLRGQTIKTESGAVILLCRNKGAFYILIAPLGDSQPVIMVFFFGASMSQPTGNLLILQRNSMNHLSFLSATLRDFMVSHSDVIQPK